MDLTDYINEKKTGPTPKVIQAIMEQLAVVMSKGGVEFYKLSITDTLVYKLLDKGGINYFVLKLEVMAAIWWGWRAGQALHPACTC